VVVASSNRQRVDAALRRLPKNASGHAVDLRSETAIRELFETLGDFDHLAHTAGEPLALGPIDETDVGAAQRALEIRLWGAYAAVKHAHRHIRPGGSIVLSSGAAGARPHPTWTVAASLCGAIEALTRTLALELAPIRVNATAAGVIRTDLWAGMTEDAREGMYATLAETLPAGRVGEAGDVAEAIAHLMRNAYTTGTVLQVDGGALLV
jgi:NAD(P)-dependent dehydrogenase (short-subunit alcohol dehydrogenase family)